jgi:hypothetical protein
VTFTIDDTKIATELSLRAIARVVTSGGNRLSRYWQQHKARDAATYSDYLIRKGVRANSIRNFIYDTKSASLYDIYVPTSFTIQAEDGSRDYSGDGLLKLMSTRMLTDSRSLLTNPRSRPTKASVILGVAGAGKSLFMRHAFFALQNMPPYRIPILIEVRSFNRTDIGDLEQRITDDIASTGVSITREQVNAALESGIFFILLDGMDELKTSFTVSQKGNKSLETMKGIQEHYEAELITFAGKYPLCPILVSTRPMSKVYSWAAFDVRTIAPLELPDALKLVSKLEFDKGVKLRFRRLLSERLFYSHYELASIPLLCIVMLLTYSNTGYIANYHYEFYEDAFNALWSKHDSRKDGFIREKKSGLQKSEFLRVLSGFAMSSYNSGDYDIRETQIDKHFAAAVKLSAIKCDQEGFLEDFTTSTSLGIYDGPYLRFCHRSFHEYFSAVFLTQVGDKDVGKLLEDISDRLETDNVMSLLLSIKPEQIEKHWIAKRIGEVEKTLKDLDHVSYRRLADLRILKIMSQIRSLYRFKNGSEQIQAALDARRQMMASEEKTVADVEMEALFAKDYESFMQLAKDIREKYAQKSSALEEMLRRRPKAKR